MKLTKSRLKQLIKEELAFLGALETELNFAKKHGLEWADAASVLVKEDDEDDTYEEEYYGSRTWEQDQEDAERRDASEERMQDLEDHLRQKFADAITIPLSKGLSADAIQQTFFNTYNHVTTHGRDMRKP